MPDLTNRVVVLISDDMRSRLETAARADERSVSSYVRWVLSRSLSMPMAEEFEGGSDD